MTNEISELNIYVKRKDVVGFLRVYVRLVVEGRSLPMPSTIDVQRAKSGWLTCLQDVVGSFSADFVEKVAQYWVKLSQRHGNPSSPDFARDILTILHNQAWVPPKTSAPTQKFDTDAVAPQISQRYYNHGQILNEDQVQKLSQKCIRDNDADGFIIAYLALLKLEIRPQVPMSTVLDVISNKWEEIIVREFGVSPSDVFLLTIATRWFYIVNLKGLPMTLPQLHAIAAYFETHRIPGQRETQADQTAGKKRKFWWFG